MGDDTSGDDETELMTNFETYESGEQPTRTITGRQIAALAAVIIALLFVFQNTRTTTVNFLLWDVKSPLWMWFLALLLIGAAAGALVARHRAKQ